MEKCRFPNKLRRFRQLFWLSQKEVASILGLKDSSQISRWEKGITVPNIENLFRLAKIYQTLPAEMYIDVWQSISQEMKAKEQDLSALRKRFNSKEL